jgi:hypothetical protein
MTYHPRVSKKSRRQSVNGRLANQFAKRLAKGLVIDRTQADVKLRPTIAPKELRT